MANVEQKTDATAPEASLCVVDRGASTPLIDAVKSSKYRIFINNLVERTAGARYLEIGSWTGSTLCSAIHGNSVRALSIDNWSEFGGPSREFFSNLSKNCDDKTRVSVLTEDFRTVRYDAFGKFNIYMFDGPHKYQDQFDALGNTLACLDEQFVYVADDWNWEQVRSGTFDAIRALNLSILFHVEIRTTLDNSHPKIASKRSDWHNGYFISVLRQAG